VDRVIDFYRGAGRLRPTGEHEDPEGMAIKPLVLHNNLMLAGGISSPNRSSDLPVIISTFSSEPNSPLIAASTQLCTCFCALPKNGKRRRMALEVQRGVA
jgi:hypothetical protein